LWTPTRAVRGASGREFRTNHRAILTAGEAESKSTGATVVYELWVDPSNIVIIDPKSRSSSSTSSSNTLAKEWVVLDLSAPVPIPKPLAKSAAKLDVPDQVPRGPQQQARAGTTPRELGKAFATMAKPSARDAAKVSANSAATAAKPPAAAGAAAKPPATKKAKQDLAKSKAATPSAADSGHSAGGLAAVPKEPGTEAATPAEPPPEPNNFQLLHGPANFNSPVKAPLSKLPPGLPKVVKDMGPRVPAPNNKDKERAEQADDDNDAGSECTVSDAESEDSGEIKKTPDAVKSKTSPARKRQQRGRGKKKA